MTDRKRYLFRVVVDGTTVRCFQTKHAALWRARDWSQRSGYQESLVRVERSAPVEFEPSGDDGRPTVYVVSVLRNGEYL